MGSTSKRLLIYLVILISVAASIFFMKYTGSRNVLNKIIFFDQGNLNIVKQAAKWTVLRAFFVRVSLLLFVLTSSVMACRIIIGRSSPATEQDPVIIATLNRVLTNTIEQTLIFSGLYFYFIFDRADERFTYNQILTIASWFIVGRIYFAVVYVFGQLIKMPFLRTFGFAINIGIVVLLIQACFLPSTRIASFFFSI